VVVQTGVWAAPAAGTGDATSRAWKPASPRSGDRRLVLCHQPLMREIVDDQS
jgi:hypothetical protein